MDPIQRWTQTATRTAPERSLTPPAEGYWSDKELDALDKEAQAEANRLVRDSDWWLEQMEGLNFCQGIAFALAECRRNFDAACNGDANARDLVLRALHPVFKAADSHAFEVEQEKRLDGRVDE